MDAIDRFFTQPRVSVSALFHDLGRVIPDDQTVFTVTLEMPALSALSLLDKHNYSQAPVVERSAVLGLFSHRTLSRKLLYWQRMDDTIPLNDRSVEDCFEEDKPFARVTDDVRKWFDVLESEGALLVGEPNRLDAIVTPYDISRDLDKVSGPFILLQEIELTIRALLRTAVDADELATWRAYQYGRTTSI